MRLFPPFIASLKSTTKASIPTTISKTEVPKPGFGQFYDLEEVMSEEKWQKFEKGEKVPKEIKVIKEELSAKGYTAKFIQVLKNRKVIAVDDKNTKGAFANDAAAVKALFNARRANNPGEIDNLIADAKKEDVDTFRTFEELRAIPTWKDDFEAAAPQKTNQLGSENSLPGMKTKKKSRRGRGQRKDRARLRQETQQKPQS